jgi:hypothetical protein
MRGAKQEKKQGEKHEYWLVYLDEHKFFVFGSVKGDSRSNWVVVPIDPDCYQGIPRANGGTVKMGMNRRDRTICRHPGPLEI